jgi:RNA polymerase sigma factor (sigma-70 family)
MSAEQEFLNAIKANQGIIRKLVGLYASTDADKEDYYQEILLNAWKAYLRFRGDSKFSTWLYKVSLNTILTAQRKVNRTEYHDEIADHAATTHAAPLATENAQALRMAIRKLNETDRAIITLHLDGFGNNEISEIIGITLNHVAVKLHRIKTQLTNLLQPR